MSSSLHLYDTLSGSVRAFEPLNAGQVKMYVCGPTVYDDAHLGHARCYITWDVLFRHLRQLGLDVHYVRNVTDVDDKIINKAKAENADIHDISERYFQRFSEDMSALNVLEPSAQPKATDHIDRMLEAISDLVKKEAAYCAPDGTVYFRTGACADYGKLSKKPLDDLKAGARVEVDTNKESPLDFALWKAVPEDEVFAWDSPFVKEGKGRPGWHIECSAMNFDAFGSQIDIHAGGADLIFPHHENEIAQSECWTGQKPFANYWLHNGFVNVSGEKMSKSLGNFATIRDVLKAYDANVVRYFLLQHHYRMPVDFNDEALGASQNRIQKIYRLFKKSLDSSAPYSQTGKPTPVELPAAYLEVMSEDLNTSKALAVFNQLLSQAEQELTGEQFSSSLEQALMIWDALGFQRELAFKEADLPDDKLATLASQYGISLDSPSSLQTLNALIEARKTAKASKNWADADGIRNALMAMGIQLMDNKDGTTTFELL